MREGIGRVLKAHMPPLCNLSGKYGTGLPRVIAYSNHIVERVIQELVYMFGISIVPLKTDLP